jgi:TldD protein
MNFMNINAINPKALWTRRTWLVRNISTAFVSVPTTRLARVLSENPPGADVLADAAHTSGLASRSAVDPSPDAPTTKDREVRAQQAVDAAVRAGAQYADARLTRTEYHSYRFGDIGVWARDVVGIGVRALVNGYWGFAATPSADRAAAERLAQAAVAQAAVNARGALPRTVDLGRLAPARGTWATPVTIDPFTVPIEEKHALMKYWEACAEREGVYLDHLPSRLHFARQERIVATSDGARFVQTVYESGGEIMVAASDNPLLRGVGNLRLPIQKISTAAKGWELFLDAKIPDQMRAMPDRFVATQHLRATAKPALVGRYTVVCDGTTMAALLGATFGVATQLDRALGYEANADGTSFLDDPLDMAGTFQVASPFVTVTGNRSAPGQLATVKWDDEGVELQPFTVIKAGILTDYQTIREQAAWLAPYYTKVGRPVRSNGCAAAEDALGITQQHVPNLALEPAPSGGSLDDLIATVKSGLFLEGGTVFQMDAQARNGLLAVASCREIKDGRLGGLRQGGWVLFNTLNLWKHVTAVGGAATAAVLPFSQYPYGGEFGSIFHNLVKGQPAQASSYSVQAVAATIANQAVIDPKRKA